jgi:hypothetical protein
MANQNSTLPPATLHQGSLLDRYEIYRANAESFGWPVKTFEEWLDS